MAVYLVDYENVYVDGLQDIGNLTEQDSVYIFYTQNRCNLTFQLYQKLISCKANIYLQEVSVTLKAGDPVKNALDMQLIMFAGYLIGTKQVSEIYIISKDKDFLLGIDFYQNYIYNKNIILKTIPTIKISDKNNQAQHSQKLPPEQESNILELIKKSNTLSELNTIVINYKTTAIYQELKPQFEILKALLKNIPDTPCQNIIKNVLSNNLDEKTLAEICEIAKTSDTLTELYHILIMHYPHCEQARTIYKTLKPQVKTLKLKPKQDTNNINNAIKNLLDNTENTTDIKTITEVSEIITKSNTLGELLHELYGLYGYGTRKASIIYIKLEPQFEKLRMLVKPEKNSDMHDTEFLNTIKNLLGNTIDSKTLVEISEIVEKSNSLDELHKTLVNYYKDTSKANVIYQKLKPQFKIIKEQSKTKNISNMQHHQNTIKNLLGNTIDNKTLTDICEILKKSNSLTELNNQLSKYYHDSEKSSVIYRKLKPQFELLHQLVKSC